MGKIGSLALIIILLVACGVAFSGTVKAGSKTIVVPDDYLTIASAIGNATDGDTVFVRNGTYEGPVNQTIVVDRSISIVGENAKTTIIKLYPAYSVRWILTAEFFTYSDALTLSADDCRLLNLTVIAAGYISAIGNQIQIVGNNITTGPSIGMAVNGSYCKITDNKMVGFIRLNGSFSHVARNSLDNIYVYGSSNVIKDNTCQGLGLSNSTYNVFSRNKVWSDSLGYSGIDLMWSTDNVFFRNEISGFSSGFRFWFSSENLIIANTIADSFRSISLGGSYNNKIYLNNFVENKLWSPYVWDDYVDRNYRDAYPNMAPATNLWDNGSLGNYWENYNGTDANGDGIGDSPYILRSDPSHGILDLIYGQDNFPLMTKVNIDSIILELPEWVFNLPPEPQTTNPQIEKSTRLEPEPTAPSLNPSPESQTQSKQELTSPEPYPTLTVITVSAAAVVAIAAGLLVFYSKRRRGAGLV